MSGDAEVRPYRIEVPEAELVELRERLDRVRWAPADGGPGYGVPVARVRELVECWRERYDWRASERRLNAHPQYSTVVDGATVHFLHVRSPEAGAVPLLLSHGWPGSVAEYLEVLGPLSDPRGHGLDPSIAFDLVVPSLPGSGFSGPAAGSGWGPRRIAGAWAALMRRLGYRRYGAAGNDWGSAVSLALGRVDPEHVVGVHVTQAWEPPPDDDPKWIDGLSRRDRAAWQAGRDYAEHGAAYGVVHAQAPQTLAHALADSPAGLLGWNAQAMDGYGLTDEQILTHVTIHWLTGTGGSAVRIYADAAAETPATGRGTVPVGVAQFPDDLPTVRAFAEHRHHVVAWTEHDRGGHYAAQQVPELLVEDLRAYFGTVRPSAAVRSR
jgi:epoxide hydrolase